MSHPLATTAALRRALTPGTIVKIENHWHPHTSRTTTVHAKTNTVDLVTYAYNREGKLVPSHMSWPKKGEVRPGADDRTVLIDKPEQVGPRGQRIGTTMVPFLAITILEGEHPDALGPHSPAHREAGA